MVADDGHDRVREIHLGQNLRAHRACVFMLLELSRRELAGLVEDVLGHGELADVVQQRRCLERA